MPETNFILKPFLVFGVLCLVSCGGSGGSSGEDEVSGGGGSDADVTPEEPATFYSLPAEWAVEAIEDQNCVGSNGEVYTETASKFYTWLTGDLEAARYEPIGEVANYFGFAAIRNEIRDIHGDLADEGYRGAVYREILELLDEDQRDILYDLLEIHRTTLDAFLAERVLLVEELWALKVDDPIDFDTVSDLILSIGELEAEITATSAEKYAEVLALMSADQLQYLQDMRTLVNGVTIENMQNTVLTPYGADANAQFEALNETDQLYMVEVVSKLIAYATGTVNDAHFLPSGKIGNFFGFASYRYVDRAGVSRGQAAGYVDGVLTSDQQEILCGLAENVVDYTNDYIDGREELITALWPPALPAPGLIDDYAGLAGVGEGRRSVIEAMTFHLIESMMSDSQIQELIDIRYGD